MCTIKFVSNNHIKIHYYSNDKTYEKHLLENITKEYKKGNINKIDKINKEAAEIANDLKIDDRVDEMPKPEPYITLKIIKKDSQADYTSG